MIFETLAHMADRADDDKDNFSSDFNQAKRVLDDVKNTGTKTVIDFATKGGDTQMQDEKIKEYKHYLVGMQQKQPQSVIQNNVDSSSSSSSSSLDASYQPSLQCEGGTEPSMVLTVTGASGTVEWCGLTWDLDGGDSGLEQEVCPTNYIRRKNYLGTPTTRYNVQERWTNFQAVDNRLKLNRNMAYSGTGTGSQYAIVSVRTPSIGGVPTSHQDRRFRWTSGGVTQTLSSTLSLGLITDVPFTATKNDYRIPDDFFGSHTVNGITYTWSRGTNW